MKKRIFKPKKGQPFKSAEVAFQQSPSITGKSKRRKMK